MKKLVSLILVTTLLAVVLTTSASATGSAIPVKGTEQFKWGEWRSFTTTDIKKDNCLIKIKAGTRNFTGTLEGVGTEDLTLLSQGPCEGIYPGLYNDNWYSKGTFVGDVNGKTGTFRYEITAQGFVGDSGGSGEAIMIILKGKGDLAKLYGVLDLSWPPLDYTGTIWFRR